MTLSNDGYTEPKDMLRDDISLYKYGVLVTSLEEEILTIAQLYRDRADCENHFGKHLPSSTGFLVLSYSQWYPDFRSSGGEKLKMAA